MVFKPTSLGLLRWLFTPVKLFEDGDLGDGSSDYDAGAASDAQAAENEAQQDADFGSDGDGEEGGSRRDDKPTSSVSDFFSGVSDTFAEWASGSTSIAHAEQLANAGLTSAQVNGADGWTSVKDYLSNPDNYPTVQNKENGKLEAFYNPDIKQIGQVWYDDKGNFNVTYADNSASGFSHGYSYSYDSSTTDWSWDYSYEASFEGVLQQQIAQQLTDSQWSMNPFKDTYEEIYSSISNVTVHEYGMATVVSFMQDDWVLDNHYMGFADSSVPVTEMTYEQSSIVTEIALSLGADLTPPEIATLNATVSTFGTFMLGYLTGAIKAPQYIGYSTEMTLIGVGFIDQLMSSALTQSEIQQLGNRAFFNHVLSQFDGEGFAEATSMIDRVSAISLLAQDKKREKMIEENYTVDLLNGEIYRWFAGGTGYSAFMPGSPNATIEPVDVGAKMMGYSGGRLDSEANSWFQTGAYASEPGGDRFIQSYHPYSSHEALLDKSTVIDPNSYIKPTSVRAYEKYIREYNDYIDEYNQYIADRNSVKAWYESQANALNSKIEQYKEDINKFNVLLEEFKSDGKITKEEYSTYTTQREDLLNRESNILSSQETLTTTATEKFEALDNAFKPKTEELTSLNELLNSRKYMDVIRWD